MDRRLDVNVALSLRKSVSDELRTCFQHRQENAAFI